MSAKTHDATRRAVVTGLAAAPVAALPALASVSSSADPIFQAFAAFERAKVVDEVASKASKDQCAATLNAFEAAGVKPHQILTRRKLKLRHECGLLSDSEYAERAAALGGCESELQGMWSVVEDLVETADAAEEVRGEAEREFLETAPTTRAGALLLLRHLADFLDGDDVINDAHIGDAIGDAIRNAIAVFESEAQS
jgi:hypothetical protein